MIIDDTSAVELRWEGEELVVTYSAAVPTRKVFVKSAGTTKRMKLVRR